MKNTNIIKNKKLILLCLVLFTACHKKEKERICDVYASQQGYEIGTVESYVKTSLKVTYKYKYTANGIAHTGNEKAYGIGQLDETMIGRKFIVVYNSSNPSESDLNTNYEIKAPGDLNKYLSEFKASPAKPDYPRKKCN